MDIPGYEIGELLGTGGFGTVHRARQLAVQRAVALKIDSRTLATDRDKRRFLREVTAAGRLSGHPNVVAVYDAGVLADGRPYMVLELCPGGSLNDRLQATGPVPAAEVRDIGIRISDALAAAHAAGVLHRDVKPGNILIDQYGNVALADFGLAAMSGPDLESSATRGSLTPAYAPPEAFKMTEPSPAGDVYSLAATLYALLLGRPPHFPPDRQLSIAELVAVHSRPVPDLPGVPPALVTVLRQGMAYHPADRPPGAAGLRDALAAADLGAAASIAVPAPPPVRAAAQYGTGTDPAQSGGTTSPARNRRTRPTLSFGLVFGASALVAASILGAGALIALYGRDRTTPGDTNRTTNAQQSPGAPAGSTGRDPSGGGPGTGDGYGVPTVTQDCTAATVTGARASCTRTAECWGGIVSISGDARATRYDCRQVHTYETFAIAVMPPDGETWNDAELAKNPTVSKVCARTVLLRSRRGDGLNKPVRKWSVAVLPPAQSAFDQGSRTYRCLASLGLDGLRGTAFRPLT